MHSGTFGDWCTNFDKRLRASQIGRSAYNGLKYGGGVAAVGALGILAVTNTPGVEKFAVPGLCLGAGLAAGAITGAGAGVLSGNAEKAVERAKILGAMSGMGIFCVVAGLSALSYYKIGSIGR